MVFLSNVIVISLTLVNSNALGDTPSNYDDCVKVAGENLCNYLFDKNPTQNNAPQNLPAQGEFTSNSSNSTYATYNDNDPVLVLTFQGIGSVDSIIPSGIQ